MSHTRHHKDSNQSASLVERVAGTIPAAMVQMVLLHWVDTIQKRLMKHEQKIKSVEQLKSAIFLNMHDQPFHKQFFSLYAGFKNGLKYKLMQTTYKFACQPKVVDKLRKCGVDEYMQARFHWTSSTSNQFLNGISGLIIGVFEVILIPVDLAKIMQQNNPELRNKKLSYLVRQKVITDGVQGAFNGAGATVLRNAPGSGALFLTPHVVSQKVFGCEKEDATPMQKTISNVSGSLASLTVSNPQDVVKVRKQSKLNKLSYPKIIKDIVEKEGLKGFNKSLLTKYITQGPKLTVVATLSDYFTELAHQGKERVLSQFFPPAVVVSETNIDQKEEQKKFRR